MNLNDKRVLNRALRKKIAELKAEIERLEKKLRRIV